MNANATYAPGSLRKARRARGLSQEALARTASCSTAYVRVLEGGFVPHEPEEAPAYVRVLEALGVDASPTAASAEASAEGPTPSETSDAGV